MEVNLGICFLFVTLCDRSDAKTKTEKSAVTGILTKHLPNVNSIFPKLVASEKMSVSDVRAWLQHFLALKCHPVSFAQITHG